ncbi:hypothetical protein MGWOODY_Clf1815 [hydrothermal vent metagenome]|uniref:Uncharacterized protein n=1 Tax=hydrothermal vent metagenome TaxID=652676 RepID=A0A160VCS8_9ZZZZ
MFIGLGLDASGPDSGGFSSLNIRSLKALSLDVVMVSNLPV